MKSKESNHKYTDCIPESTLIAYLKDELSGAERNAVERHLSICPMCADVLDGLSELESPDEIYEIEEEINRDIDKSLAKRNASTFQYKTLLNVAAGVTLVLAVSSLIYYFISTMPSNTVLSEGLKIEEEIMPLDSKAIEPPSGSIQEDDKPHEEAALKKNVEEEPMHKEPNVQVRQSLKSPAVKRAKETERPQPPEPKNDAESINIVDDDINIEAAFDVDEVLVNEKEKTSQSQANSFFFAEEEEVIEEEVFMVVEEMPTFIGNNKYKDFKEYISKNIEYPEFAAECGIEGRVFVQFIVEPDGSVSNVEVVRGVSPELDKEALRVVRNSPKWEPGKQRGVPVRVSFSFPVTFSLQ
ncbi:MAG: TonB family protein [Perlabentimonas sp.]